MRTKLVSKYSSISKAFHWIIAVAVVVMLIVGFLLADFPASLQDSAYMLHKSTGITILFLMILRFIWIHASGKPALPQSVKRWEKWLSRFVQYSFYALLIVMPLSGWIMSVAADYTPVFFGLFKAPLPWIGVNKSLADFMAQSHLIIAWILIAFIVIHILGALKHHFIDKDDVLRKMLPGQKEDS